MEKHKVGGCGNLSPYTQFETEPYFLNRMKMNQSIQNKNIFFQKTCHSAMLFKLITRAQDWGVYISAFRIILQSFHGDQEN